jgi:tetratricopeptide (TPR) repeat protein
MKNILFILLFSTQIFFAQSFEKGNKSYQKENYEEAIIHYESILKAKKQSAELYFNLGNCYYKLNKVAPAIYNFEKALLLNPNDKDIQNNLKFAQKLQIDDIKEVPKVGFNKVIQDFTSSNHYNTWAWISVGLSTLLLLLFLGYYFSLTTFLKRIFFVGMILDLLVIILSVSSAIFEKTNYDNDKPAIVFAEITSVKTEPNENSTDAFMLHEGTKVYVFETVDNFKKIELSDGKKGWIETNKIKELK